MFKKAEQLSVEAKPLSLSMMVLCSIIVGLVGGVGAVLFRMMIAAVHNFMFLGHLDLHYNVNALQTYNPWGWMVIFVPVIGSVIVTWLVNTFAPEAKGHGVPEVMDSIYNKSGIIKPAVVLVKALASSISIGTGGSVGREGPIIQIGSAFASFLGQVVTMPVRQRIVLLAAGASAGIAATFNAPMGGLTFAIELMLVSISASSIALVVFATIVATYIGRMFLGLYPAFNIPQLAMPDWHIADPWLFLSFLIFGVLCGIASALLVRSIYWSEDFFESLPMNSYFRHMLGMLILGIMLYLFMHFSGHYYVAGVGYATIVSILSNTLSSPWFLLLLFVAKFLATNLTLGSGASGGVFSPSLFLGATLGSFFGGAVHAMFPTVAISQPEFAIAGMAALVGGATGAVLTAIVMVFEMTRDYSAILPVMLTVALAYGIRYLFSHESIYTLKLLRRGARVPSGLQAALIATRTAAQVMSQKFQTVSMQDLLSDEKPELNEDEYAIVEDDGEIVGLLRARYFHLGIRVTPENHARFIATNFLVVKPSQAWTKILCAISRKKYKTIFVTSVPGSRKVEDVIGVIASHEIIEASTWTANLMH